MWVRLSDSPLSDCRTPPCPIVGLPPVRFPDSLAHARGVGRRLVTALPVSMVERDDVAAINQGTNGDVRRATAQAGATVKLPPIAGGDAVADLRDADVISIAFEPEGAAHDVEQHLELGAG